MNDQRVSWPPFHLYTSEIVEERLSDRAKKILGKDQVKESEQATLHRELMRAVGEEPTLPLSDFFPFLEEVSVSIWDVNWLPTGSSQLNVRSSNSIQRELVKYPGGMVTWADLSSTSKEEMFRWRNFGVGSFENILDVITSLVLAKPEGLINLSATTLVDNSEIIEFDEILQSERISNELKELVFWASIEGLGTTVANLIDLAESEETPDQMRGSALLLRNLDLRKLAPEVPTFDSLIERLFELFDEREILIFSQRKLCRPAKTLDEVGEHLDLTRERIRQIESKSEVRMRELLASPEFEMLSRKSERLRKEFGTLVPIGDISLHRLVCDTLHEEISENNIEFIFWVLSSYKVDAEWIYSVPPGTIEETIVASRDDFGVLQVDPYEVLASFGIHPQFAEEILNRFEQLHSVEERWIAWGNNLVDKFVSLLALRGEPSSIEDVFSGYVESFSAPGLMDRLKNDPRATRVSKGKYGLVSWGLQSYEGIAKAIQEKIRESNGRIKISTLASELSNTFEVSELSVKAYSTAPMFVSEGGYVRMRELDEPFPVSSDIASCVGAFRTTTGVALISKVDGEVLRGSGQVLPGPVAKLLGVVPGKKVDYLSADYEVHISWPMTGHLGANLGSLRLVGEFLHAEKGQHLLLKFDVQRHSLVAQILEEVLIPNTTLSEVLEKIIDFDGKDGDQYEALAHSMMCDEREVQSTLEHRQETLLLEFFQDH